MYKTFAYLPRNFVGRCGMKNAIWGANLIGRKNKQTDVCFLKSGGGGGRSWKFKTSLKKVWKYEKDK